MGIGLSIAHTIVEAYGGRIGRERPVRGRVFHVSLPLTVARWRRPSRRTPHTNAFSSVAKITANDLSWRVTGGTGRSIFMS
ncbi:hypothetical protein ABH973_000772 [Bradyrhizobium ottawaense]